MASNRSRLARSSSSGATSILSGELRFPIPLKSPKKEKNYSVNFSISVLDCEGFDRRWNQLCGGFLDKCFYCSKSFPEREDIFMYSNLRAFCTAECRKKQIDMDEDLKTMAATPRKRRP